MQYVKSPTTVSVLRVGSPVPGAWRLGGQGTSSSPCPDVDPKCLPVDRSMWHCTVLLYDMSSHSLSTTCCRVVSMHDLFTRMIWEQRIRKICRQENHSLAKTWQRSTSCCKLSTHIAPEHTLQAAGTHHVAKNLPNRGRPSQCQCQSG